MKNRLLLNVGVAVVLACTLSTTPVPAQTCAAPPSGLVSWWQAEGNVTDVVGTNNGTLFSGTYAAGKVGQAFSFNNVSTYALIPASASLNLATNGGLTIECWIKLNDAIAPGDTATGHPLVEWNNGFNSDGFHIGVLLWNGGGPGVLVVNLVDTLGNSHTLSSPTGVLVSNVFQHVAATYDQASGVATLYRNGAVVATQNMGSFTPQTSYNLYLGKRPGTGYFNNGLLDELGLYKRALSAAEIQAIYNADSAGKCFTPSASILAQPQSQSVYAGANVSFSVSATGTAPISYQWLFNGTNLNGATSATLNLNNVQATDVGTYSVLVSNAISSTNSANAVLTVNVPTCLAPPAGLVSWWRAGGNVTDTMGTNNGTLISGTYAAGKVGQAFSFNNVSTYVLIPASASLDLATNGGLTIECWLKLNDVIAPGDTVTGHALVEWNNGFRFGVNLWNAGGPGVLVINLVDTLGNDHLLSSPTGVLVSNVFQHVAATYDQASGVATLYRNGAVVATQNLGSFTPQTGTSLYLGTRPGVGYFNNGLLDELGLYKRALSAVEIQSIYNADSAGKCFTAVAPSITTQPQSQTASVGNNASFSVSATGTAPLSYQWLFNGTNLNGATSATLNLNNVQLSYAGTYSVLVGSPDGPPSVTSSNATLTVTPAAPSIVTQPQSQSVNVGANVSISISATGTAPLNYQWQLNGTNINGATASTLNFPNVQVTNSGTYSVMVSNAISSTNSDNAVLTVNVPTCSTLPVGLVSWWRAEGNAVDAVGGNDGTLFSGTYALGKVGQAFSFNNVSTYVQIPASASLNVATNGGLTIECWIKLNNAIAPGDTVTSHPLVEWNNNSGYFGFGVHLWNAGGPGVLVVNLVDTLGNSHSLSSPTGVLVSNVFQHVAATYDQASGVATLYCNGAVVATQNLGSFTPQTSYDVYLGWRPNTGYFNNGQVDELGLYKRALSAAEIQSIYNADSTGKCFTPAAPSIVTQPQSQSVNVGTNVSFSVSAAGTGPLSYQWLLNGTNLNGATSAALNLNNVQVSDSGIYSVVVTGSYGPAATSSNATLIVTALAPSIVTQPQSQSVFVGADVSFSVSATGTAPLSYQWLLNGTNLNGATSATLNLNKVKLTDAGTYTVLVSNVVDSTNSANVVLTVNVPICVTPRAGLVSWWRAEGDVTDAVGNNNNGTLFSGTYVSGKVGQAISFNNVSTYALIPASASLNLATNGGLTIECWIKLNNAIAPGDTATGHPLVEWNNGFGSIGVLLWNAGGPGVLVVNLVDTLGNSHTLSSPTGVLVSNVFQHVAATYDQASGVATLYRNGAVVATQNMGSFTPQTSYNLYLGKRPGTGYFNNGLLDELGLYKRALSAAEIQAICNADSAGKCFTPSASILAQPQSQSVYAGANVSFSVSATGTAPFSYQWLFNGTNLNGATSATLNLNNVQLSNAGTYSVVVTSSYGPAATSSNAILSFPPIILTQPQSQTVDVGGNVSFSVAASGTPPPSYQWQLNGTTIDGATNTTLNLTNVQASDAGGYSAMVSNVGGSTNSDAAVLTIIQCLTPAKGLISWWQGEGDAHDYAGTNNATLMNGTSFAPGKVGQAFSFNGTNQFVSVPDAPALNPTTNGITFEGWVYPKSFPSSGSVVIFSKHDLVSGVIQFTFDVLKNANNNTWVFSAAVQQPGNQFVIINLTSTPLQLNTWYHVAMTYQNQSLYVYLNGALQTSATCGPLLTTTAPMSIGGELNGSGSFSGRIDELSLYDHALSPGEIQSIYNAGDQGKCSAPAPLFLTQPQSQSAIVGDTVTFVPTAIGSGALSYQWRFNGTNINGATNTTLNLTNVQLSDGGAYSVVASNSYGSTISSIAALTVNTGIPHCVTPPAGLVSWWQADGDAHDLVGTNNGTLVSGAGFALGKVGQAFNFTGNNQVVQVPNTPALNPTNGFTLEAWVYIPNFPNIDTAGIVSKHDPVSGIVQYNLGIVNISGVWYFRSVVQLGSDFAIVNGTTTPPQLNTWYHVGMTHDGSALKLYVNGILQGTIPCGAVITTPTPMTIGGELTGPWNFVGRIDELSYYSRALSSGEIQSIYNARSEGKCSAPTAPYVITQPQSQTVLLGGHVSFNVVTSGSVPLSYQWQFNGTNINGATNSVLNLLNLQFANGGVYSVMVSNGSGPTVTSSNAVLTVNGLPPSIQTPPQSKSVSAGANTSFNVAASGTAPLSYQWLFEGGLITNATSSLLNLTNVQIADEGYYSVMVSNPYGSITSSIASLTVTFTSTTSSPVLSITQTATSLILAWPASATGFNLEAVGNLPGTNWTAVSGAAVTNGTDLNLTIPLPATQNFYRLHHP
ncbi:MAG: Immunoglobulin I-set domain protein [Pedosphaera sp.]|nr:Immunoglobulin I-set domain protein [Pedosphaera sp.]